MAMMMTWARRVAVGVMAVLPLVAWPGLAQPFSTPKLSLLVVTVVALAPCAWIAWRYHVRARRFHARRSTRDAGHAPIPTHVVAALWLASWTWSALFAEVVSLDALLLALAGGGLAIVLTELRPEPARLAAAHAIGATGVAIVAVMQWAGLDPFALAGWVAPLAGASPRLRVYGTLGNPNFVAALLAGAVPLTIGLIVHAAAARVTPSRLADRARPGGADAAAPGDCRDRLPRRRARPDRRRPDLDSLRPAHLPPPRRHRLRPRRGRHHRRLHRPAAAGDAGGAHLHLAGRLAACVRGALGRPGPGGVRAALSRPGSAKPAANRRPPRRPVYFAGPQQHAHNDYLEALVERGLAGPVTLLLVLTTWRGRRETRPFRPRGSASGDAGPTPAASRPPEPSR